MAFNGTGSNVTSLNASNIASGTVPPARLASGTANSSTFLRGDSTWAAPASSGGAGPIIVVSSSAMFTTSGTYTTPTLAADEQLYALIIGGGGSGGAMGGSGAASTRSFAAGGGGRVGMALLNKASLGATIAYTIGAGGAGVNGPEASGNAGNGGGNTIISSNGYLLSLVQGGDGGNVNFNDVDSTVDSNVFDISSYQDIFLFNQTIQSINPSAPYGMQLGGRRATSATTTYIQPLFFGGGSSGQSGSTVRTQNYVGAPARTYAGAGGAGNGSGAASAGSAPGGGGGGGTRVNTTATGGAGAAGGVKFFVIKGIYDAQAAFNGVFTL